MLLLDQGVLYTMSLALWWEESRWKKRCWVQNHIRSSKKDQSDWISLKGTSHTDTTLVRNQKAREEHSKEEKRKDGRPQIQKLPKEICT